MSPELLIATATIAVGLLPYLVIRNYFPADRSIPMVGEDGDQTFVPKAAAGETLRGLLTDPDPGATIRMITNDCIKLKRNPDGTNNSWFLFLQECLNRDVGVTFFGSREIATPDELGELCSDGLRYFIIDDVPDRHVLLVDKPRQLWFEGRHRRRKRHAYDCVYTKSPREDVWRATQEALDEFEKPDRLYTP